jgi:outer membrane protein OmpA-like peptidoglycan-associated protein
MKNIIAAAVSSLLLLCSAGANAQTAENSIKFPEIKNSWVSEGDFVNIDNLRKVAPGLSKEQLYRLISRPHFNEGIFSPKVWNYVFNFRTGSGTDYVTCQYQIQFDDKEISKSTHWKDAACANFLVMPAPQVIKEITREVPVPAEFDMSKIPKPSTQNFAVAGDVLFNFNKHSLSDLRNEGRTELDKISEKIKLYKSIDLIRVIGHTDPLSSSEYNFTLSYKRAQTVKKYLISIGLDANLIQARGAGETELVKTIEECGYSNKVVKHKGKKASQSSSLQECLLPNRRVEIEVIGTK